MLVEQVRAAIAEGTTTATTITEACFQRIAEKDGEIRAFLTLRREQALGRAAEIDRMAERGDPLPPLAGVPVAVKDVMVTSGTRTTAGSRVLEHFVPAYSCTAVERLEAAGAVVIGKTNCDEFAMGSSNENSAFGAARNPHDLSTVPGGSSGGSAAAVASGMALAALGSDTGGSIRQPAAFCGVVGMMPTYGRVSRYGLIAFASSLDHIGPLTTTVRDAATVLRAIAGHDVMDSTSADVAVPDYVAELEKPLRARRIGVPREYFAEGLDGEVWRLVEAAIEKIAGLGCEIVPISLPHTAYAIPTYYVVATAEASSNLARYDGVRYGYRAADARSLAEMYRRTRDEGLGSEVKRRILLGTYVLSAGYYEAYYLKAQKVRSLLARDFELAFSSVDAIVTPTTPTAAFKIGEKIDDPLAMYLADLYTVVADLVGIPGMSVPCGTTRAGLPVGLQILGKHFDESTVLRVGHAYETARDAA
jgi:aspartyl-tRNA(Asn)/glutamyl-tRNA(Gln) amidotransferase subunit A